ncbi:hypothetical protein [Spirosoma horti]
MFHSALRQAIARAFPDRYSLFTWKRLLTDFVEVHLKAFLIQRDYYEQQRAQNRETSYPAISPELQQAVTLLARQKKHSYAFLALTHHLLQLELAAQMKAADHYRQQAEGHEQVMHGYQRLASQAISSLNQEDNL